MDDITARNVAEESVSSSEAFNRTVLASLQDHIAILDRHGNVLAVNEAWLEFATRNAAPHTTAGLGVGENYLAVCRRAVVSGDETAARALDGIERVLRGDSDHFAMEYECDGPSEARSFAMRVLPLKRAQGGAVISHSNITERRKAELELGRQRNELAHFSRVSMLGQLSGSLAHELNQPLTAIRSNAQAALRFLSAGNFARDEIREILRDIVEAENRASEVIQGLRLLLKKGEIRQEKLDLNAVVLGALRLLRSDILSAHIDLTVQLEPGLPAITADRVQLEQVLLNLVMNGCDAMAGVAASQRRLIVATARVADDEIRVRVIDRGPGIPPDDLERVFEPFYSTKSDGLGLGLAISSQIIAAHRGRLFAKNERGGGASFCFTLPVGGRAA
jgi:C4-dicarboxylate-specific signal transduction histidine kinase